LAELISKRGQKTFLSAPLLLPTDACFPDPWSPDADGVRRLALRLLQYAGLDQLPVEVQIFENPEEIKSISAEGRPASTSHQGAAAWYAGMLGGVCQFGAETRQLAQSEGIVGAMCHEIAHAYRHYHQLEHWDHDLEERLTDLTTIYLGFGVLTVNISYRYRAESIREGTLGASRHSHQQMGYLSPQSMSFLLAAQVVARLLSPDEKKSIARHLETNQRAYFKSAIKHLEKNREALMQQLGLSEKSTTALAVVVGLGASDKGAGQFNLFLPVFRVQKSRTGFLGALGFVFGGMAASLLYWLFSSLVLSVGVVLVAFFVGALMGQRIKRDVCSDPKCGALLPFKAATCAQCGGQLSGSLLGQRQHSEAALRLLQSTNERDSTH
jgi:ribosomal protein L40E